MTLTPQILQIGKQINWPSNYGVLLRHKSRDQFRHFAEKVFQKSAYLAANWKCSRPCDCDARTGRHRHMDLFNFNRISEEWTSYKSTYKTLPINPNKLILFAVRIWKVHCWHTMFGFDLFKLRLISESVSALASLVPGSFLTVANLTANMNGCSVATFW